MIDELLGRASLKARIADLESERDGLRNRYEAESERRADAVRAKQDAQERCNRLQDQIAQLEGELERLDGEPPSPSFRRRERLRGPRLRTVLDRLTSVRTDAEGAFTAVVERGTETALRRAETDPLGDRTALLDDVPGSVLCVDDAGLVAVALDPPTTPDVEPGWSDRFELESAWFLPSGRYALALVRADLFALGLYDDGERVEYRGFESDVKGRHSKGGFSQARFERIRDEQIDDHLDRAGETLAALDSDAPLYLVGQRGVVETLAEEGPVDPAATAFVDATGKPDSALADAHRSFWTTELRVF